MIWVLYVARDEHSLPAGVPHESLSLLGILVLAEIGNEHVGAFARVGDRNGAADTAICASDDRLLVCESTAAAIAALAVVGHRFHRFRFTGHRLFLFGKGRLGTRSHGSGTLGLSNELLERILNGRVGTRFHGF